MKRRKFVAWILGLPFVAFALRLRAQAEIQRVEFMAEFDCTVGRMEIIGADGKLRATRRLALPATMRVGDTLVITLKALE